MAEAPRFIVEKGLEKLAQEITCSVCQQHFRDPRVLPCSHYFCGECIRALASAAGTGRPFACPAAGCRRSTVLPDGDPGRLPAVFFIKRLAELHSRMSKIERKTEAPCEMCSGEKAEAFCRQCSEFICGDCAHSHRKMKAKYPDHQVVTLAELREGGARLLPLAVKPAPPQKCSDHCEDIKLYCFDCCQLICRDCTVIDHAQHKYEFIKKSVSQCRQSLQDSLTPLGKLVGDISEATKRIQVVKSDVSSQGGYIREHVEQSFDEMIEILQQRKQQLLDQTTGLVQSKLDTLAAQEKGLGVVAAELQNLADFVHRNLDTVTDEDLLSIHQQLLSRVAEKLEESEKTSLTPTEVANLAVSISCSEEIASVCQNRARVYLFPVKDRTQVHMAELGQVTTNYIIDSSDQSPKKMEDAQAKLTSLVDSSTIPAKVSQAGKGLYEVTYCPQVRGRHELSIEVNGNRVSYSPFLVFVKIPPSLLGEPLQVIEGLRHPYAAAFNSEQELLVTESGGQRIRAVKNSEKEPEVRDFAEISNPTGLALDRDDTTYVVNVSNHSVSKHSRDGRRLEVAGREGSQQGEFSHPSGIAVIGNEVYVCDRNNSRIQVFDKHLSYIRSFGCHGNNTGELHWPYDLTPGLDGHIYVTDCDNHRVQIFDPEGHFVHAFGSRGAEKGCLKRPMGICLGTDQLLYVTEYGNHRISVFKTTGEFVHCFCTYGNKKGELCYPVGVAIDRDGFVYICDQGNNRIQVF